MPTNNFWMTLKQAISNEIKNNGNQYITGQVLQEVLLKIITIVGENATFAGVAEPDTLPPTTTGPIFYIATTPGTYPNFHDEKLQALTLEENRLGLLRTVEPGVWVMEPLDIATASYVEELAGAVTTIKERQNLLADYNVVNGKIAKVTKGNLIDFNDITPDAYVDSNTGELKDTGNSSASGYTYIKGASRIVISKLAYNVYERGAFYDADKNFISGITVNDLRTPNGNSIFHNVIVEVPKNAAYVRIGMTKSAVENQTAYIVNYNNVDIEVEYPWLKTKGDGSETGDSDKIKNLISWKPFTGIEHTGLYLAPGSNVASQYKGIQYDKSSDTYEFDIRPFRGKTLLINATGLPNNSFGPEFLIYEEKELGRYNPIMRTFSGFDIKDYSFEVLDTYSKLVIESSTGEIEIFCGDYLLKPTNRSVRDRIGAMESFGTLPTGRTVEVVEGNMLKDTSWEDNMLLVGQRGYTLSDQKGVFKVSDYISVEYNKHLLISKLHYFGCSFYDRNKNFISGVNGFANADSKETENQYSSNQIIDVPENANYIRVNMLAKDVDNGTAYLVGDVTRIPSGAASYDSRENSNIKVTFPWLIAPNNQWAGKKIVWLGGSVPYGKGSEVSYPDLIAKRLQCEVVNTAMPDQALHIGEDGRPIGEGASCLSIAEYKALGIDDPGYRSYENCLLHQNADLYVFDCEYGNFHSDLNDFEAFDFTTWKYRGNDAVSLHRKSYLGALIYMLTQLFKENPKARIVFVGEYGYVNDEMFGHPYPFRNNTSQIATALNAAYINVFDKLQYNAFNKSMLCDSVGLPTTETHKMIADILTNELLLIR